MSYSRVIPRDLFNEADLLKCYGRLALDIEKFAPHVELIHEGETFEIEQSTADGSISIANIKLYVRGDTIRLSRPLNTRRNYAIWAYPSPDCELQVFTENGVFTKEMNRFLKSGEIT